MIVRCRRNRPLAAALVALGSLAAAAPAHAQLFDWLKKDKDSQDVWAIRCMTLSGPNAPDIARRYAEALKKAQGFKPELVRVFDEAGGSSLYYGEFKRRFDKRTQKESFEPNPIPTLEALRKLSLGGQDIWPFELATMSTLPAGSGVRPDWLLRGASGYWSLQVAVFYDEGEFRERRQAAEQYCKLLRDQGEEAYLDHGDVNSIVCVGSFPKEAIQGFQRKHPLTGIVEFTERIVDERMLALQKKFPHNLHNGATFYEIRRDPRTGEKIRDPHTSFAVKIPRPEPIAPAGG